MSTLKITATQDNTEFAGLSLRDTDNGSEITLVLPGDKKFQFSVENEGSRQRLFYVDTEGNEIGYSSDKPILTTLPKFSVSWTGNKNWLSVLANKAWTLAWPVIRPWARRFAEHLLRNLSVSMTYPEKSALLSGKLGFQGCTADLRASSKHSDLVKTIKGEKILQTIVALNEAEEFTAANVVKSLQGIAEISGSIEDMGCEFMITDQEQNGVSVEMDIKEVMFQDGGRMSGKKLFAEVSSAVFYTKTDLSDFDLDEAAVADLSTSIINNLS